MPSNTPWLDAELGPNVESDPEMADLLYVRDRLREEIQRTGKPEIEFLREYMLHDQNDTSFFGALINAPERLGCIDYIIDHLEDEFIHEALELQEKGKKDGIREQK